MRRVPVLAVAVGVLAASAGVGAAALGGSGPGGDVTVMYPPALTYLMEDWVGPAFDRATPYTFRGEATGSLSGASLIKDHVRAPDVFIAPDPAVDRSLQGPANGGWVSWWVAFAGSQLVLAWNPAGADAAAFNEVNENLRTVESALALPRVRLCRADPELDPQGYQTLMALQLDQARSGQLGLAASLLGADENPAQVFGAETLTTRLQSGACDAAFLYEAQALDAALPFAVLDPAINLGDPTQAALYATAGYTPPGGQRVAGSPIAITATIPASVRNARGAVAFLQELLGTEGQAILTQQGLQAVPATPGGDTSQVPGPVAAAIAAQPPVSPSPPADTTGTAHAPTG